MADQLGPLVLFVKKNKDIARGYAANESNQLGVFEVG